MQNKGKRIKEDKNVFTYQTGVSNTMQYNIKVFHMVKLETCKSIK